MVLLNLLPIFTLLKTYEIIPFLVFILIVAIVFVFIRRMEVFGNSSCYRVNRPQISAQSMVMVKNPFMFEICERIAGENDFVNGIKLKLMCDNSFWLINYWGVNIGDFHNCLLIDWQTMRQQVLDELFLSNYCLDQSKPDLFHECNEITIHSIKPTDGFSEGCLGDNPRTRYPLVIVAIRNDDDDGQELSQIDVVCLITVVHLKGVNSTIKINTGIICQYLKQRNGNIYNLQQIYTPDPITPFTQSTQSQNSQMCVICQTTAISRTILPCRHACVCGSCFERIDKCPLCRCDIASFFNIRDEQIDTDCASDSNDSHDSQQINQNRSNNGWFSNINAKLNQWFGML